MHAMGALYNLQLRPPSPPPSLFVGMNAVEMLQAYNYNLMAAVTIESPVSYQL